MVLITPSATQLCKEQCGSHVSDQRIQVLCYSFNEATSAERRHFRSCKTCRAKFAVAHRAIKHPSPVDIAMYLKERCVCNCPPSEAYVEVADELYGRRCLRCWRVISDLLHLLPDDNPVYAKL